VPRFRAFISVVALLFAIGCQSTAPPATNTPRPQPTFATEPAVTELCFGVDTAWKVGDWPVVIETLERVAQAGGQCGGQDAALKLYPAWYNYGMNLEKQGKTDAAIDAYRHAMLYNPLGVEAANALKRRAALTPMPLETCPADQIRTAIPSLPAYQTTGKGAFVQLQNGAFAVERVPFTVRGINYYPARAPWRRFLAEAQRETMVKELDLLKDARFNTIRIFLWYEALFDCPGNGVVPNATAFGIVDSVIQLAAQRNMYVIVTLNDLPDLTIRPLYTNPERPNLYTRYVVDRYRAEPTILAWDLRNEGDIDYIRGLANARAVIDWLKATATLVRQIDPNHLITAGWNDDAGSTRNAVDFISFHHWAQPDALVDRVKAIRALTDKPILLQEVGYTARATGEAAQAELLDGALKAAEASNLLGWMVWAAFDFTPDVTCIPPACPGTDNAEHHFGLWRADYTPKPALQVVKAIP
jgi:hypothetical protein